MQDAFTDHAWADPLAACAQFSTFAPHQAKGGCALVARKTALVCLELQHEFTSEGGKLHAAVKGVMKSTDMLAKVARLQEEVRAAGGTVVHAPLTLRRDGSDNPNRALGILAGCAKDGLFTAGTWNAALDAATAPRRGDVLVTGKRGLDAFANTDLEAQLVARGVESLVLCGLLTNGGMGHACETERQKTAKQREISDPTQDTRPNGSTPSASQH